jgi:hypothetical protein
MGSEAVKDYGTRATKHGAKRKNQTEIILDSGRTLSQHYNFIVGVCNLNWIVKKALSLIIKTGLWSSKQNCETVKQIFSAFVGREVGRKKPSPLIPNVVDLRDKVGYVTLSGYALSSYREFPNPGCLPWASAYLPPLGEVVLPWKDWIE